MATRMKVSKDALLKAIDAALGEVDETISKVTQEQEAYDWKEEARQSVEAMTKLLKRADATEKDWDSLLSKAKGKYDRPDFGRQLSRQKHWRQELLDFKQLVEMSAGDDFSVSTGDHFIESVLRAARRAPKEDE